MDEIKRLIDKYPIGLDDLPDKDSYLKEHLAAPVQHWSKVLNSSSDV